MNYGRFQLWAFVILAPIIFIRSPDKIIGGMLAIFCLLMWAMTYPAYKEWQFHQDTPSRNRK